MSTSKKVTLGIVSLLPLVLTGLYLISFFRTFIGIIRQTQFREDAIQAALLDNLGWIIGFGILMGFCTLGLTIYFIIHVINNKVIDSTERIVWLLVFIFAGMFGFPLYWYMRIWKDQPAAI